VIAGATASRCLSPCGSHARPVHPRVAQVHERSKGTCGVWLNRATTKSPRQRCPERQRRASETANTIEIERAAAALPIRFSNRCSSASIRGSSSSTPLFQPRESPTPPNKPNSAQLPRNQKFGQSAANRQRNPERKRRISQAPTQPAARTANPCAPIFPHNSHGINPLAVPARKSPSPANANHKFCNNISPNQIRPGGDRHRRATRPNRPRRPTGPLRSNGRYCQPVPIPPATMHRTNA
jgi:hypothetical protein